MLRPPEDQSSSNWFVNGIFLMALKQLTLMMHFEVVLVKVYFSHCRAILSVRVLSSRQFVSNSSCPEMSRHRMSIHPSISRWSKEEIPGVIVTARVTVVVRADLLEKNAFLSSVCMIECVYCII